MKKSRIIFFVTMLLLIASTCTIMGATINTEGYGYGKTYSKSYTGDRTVFYAAGTATQSYTTLYNNYTSSCHMDAMVRGYDTYTGSIVDHSYAVSTKKIGESVHSGYIDRDYDNTRHRYEHTATCYLSPYQMSEIIDDYKYVLFQSN